MASVKLHLVLNSSSLSVSPCVRIDPANSSNCPTIVALHSQMRMITPAVVKPAVKPAVLQIGAVVPLLREALERRYDFYALGEQEDEEAFLAQKGSSIRGVVTCTHPDCDSAFVDRELVSKLPNLEIVSSFDDTDVMKVVDVNLCKKLGVHVTDTRDALANKCAATAIRLLMAISREVIGAGRYVRASRWPAEGNYPIPFRVSPVLTNALKAKFDHCALWAQPDKEAFLAEIGPSSRAVAIVGFQWFVIDETSLGKLPNLEIATAVSAGTSTVGTPYLKSRGVRLTNVGGVHVYSTAEYAFALTLVTTRRIILSVMGDGPLTVASVSQGRQLCNKHVGIVGLGQIGAATARRMESFGCTIGYWSRSAKPQYPNYVHYDNVVDLAKHCDILIAACSLTEYTKNIINREVLDALGPLGFVVSVSRGLVIDEAELVSALKEGRIAGAGLDVFENEPHVPDELMNLDTCVLQPHAASNTMETHQAMANMVVANLEAHFTGKPLLTPVC